MSDIDLELRRRNRRTAMLLGALAAAFFLGFILVGVLRA